MKLERAHEYILPTVVITGGIIAAMYLGGVSGKGQMGTLAAFLFVVIATFVFFTVREKVWMFIPIFYGLSGKISLLPLPLGIRHIAILFAVGSYLLFKAFKVIRRKPAYRSVDVWMLVNLIYVVTVFIRNPVGTEAMGSDRVGGRPYIEILFSCAAYWVLMLATATQREALLLPLATAFGNSLEFFLNVIVNRFPALTPVVSQFYSNISATEYENLDAKVGIVDQATQRETHYGTLGSNLVLALVSHFRPLTMINPIYIFRFLWLQFSLFCIFISGFRSLVISAFAYFCLGEYFRRGAMGVARIGLIAAPLFALLLAMQGLVFDLPFSVQRSLSFLPGRWNINALSDAQGSTEWRVEMWKLMLTTDRYIHDKWLGDGFGFTKYQLQQMYSVSEYGGVTAQQENFMISGNVHSGPVSAIKYVGYVGLLLYVCFLVAIARLAWVLMKRAYGTKYFALALFVGLPAIWDPLNYLFIFGGYENAFARSILTLGMLKMLENSLPTAVPEETAPAINPPKMPVRPPLQHVSAYARRSH